jgi:hypothetical protein
MSQAASKENLSPKKEKGSIIKMTEEEYRARIEQLARIANGLNNEIQKLKNVKVVTDK